MVRGRVTVAGMELPESLQAAAVLGELLEAVDTIVLVALRKAAGCVQWAVAAVGVSRDLASFVVGVGLVAW